MYVQDILQKQLASEVLSVLHREQGHLYVCGDVRMARDVATTVKKLVATELNLNEEQVEDYFFQLKVWKRGWDPGEGGRPRSHAIGTRTRAGALSPSAPPQKPGAGWLAGWAPGSQALRYTLAS